ncbi:transmembrane protein 222 isoform X2 [Dendropsophus ebraccatus]|uniref:transmembrane protein 222 isoform X2 n=1 Tax=Dendropsophus ebraccatus TaxID=150705 RepID=UPI0038311B1B
MAEVDVLLPVMAEVLDEKMKPDPERSRFPHCVVWTPIPVLTWLFPFIGHMGICTSSGVIRDFAGPYYVSEDCMAFGRPVKYWQLDPNLVYAGGPNPWDTAVHEASEEYKHRMCRRLPEDMGSLPVTGRGHSHNHSDLTSPVKFFYEDFQIIVCHPDPPHRLE